jgi:hypothetical protein
MFSDNIYHLRILGTGGKFKKNARGGFLGTNLFAKQQSGV